MAVGEDTVVVEEDILVAEGAMVVVEEDMAVVEGGEVVIDKNERNGRRFSLSAYPRYNYGRIKFLLPRTRRWRVGSHFL